MCCSAVHAAGCGAGKLTQLQELCGSAEHLGRVSRMHQSLAGTQVLASASLPLLPRSFVTFGHLFDSLAQPCSSSGGGSGGVAGAAPALQLSDADTGRRPSRLAPQADASSGQLIEVHQQQQQHSGQLMDVQQQQQQSGPLQELPLPSRPHVGQAAGAPGGRDGSAGDEPAGEQEPAGKAQPGKGGKAAGKAAGTYKASELTLQLLEEEVRPAEAKGRVECLWKRRKQQPELAAVPGRVEVILGASITWTGLHCSPAPLHAGML